MTIEAMKQALEALDSDNPDIQLRAATALRAAIKQAELIQRAEEAFAASEQKPVAWKWKERVNNEFDSWVVTASEPPPYAIERHPLYTAPRKWQGLTDEEIGSLWDGHVVPVFGKNGINPIVFARAIEAKLREKNT
jgi:hypothetical protein